MTLKRVLVLVMALVMVVSACAPSVLAAYKPETKHEHLEDVLNNPEYAEKYEEIKTIVETIAKDIEENHEEYYAGGYAYALENGYIDTAIETIKETLETIREIDLEGVEMTDELRGELETELDALVPTLEKLLKVLESGEASEFDGFVKAVLTFEGDLYLHMNNIYAILEQASIDLNQFALVPAFNEALRLLEEEIIPAIEETVEAYVDYVVEVLTPYYEKAVEVIGIAYDTYELLVETIVKINLYVEGAIDTVVNAYNALLSTLLEVYGTVENAIEALENAIKTAHEVYNDIIDAIVELNAKVENTIEKVEQFIIKATEAYRYTVKVLVEVYGHVKNAVIVAGQVYNYLVDLFVENKPFIEEGLVTGAELASQVYADIIEIVKAAYGEKNDVYYVATRISAYIANLLAQLDSAIQDKLDSAYVGNYELKDDSAYVSIGNAAYADALAGKLNLSNKHTVVTFGSDYINDLINADLVTAKFDNGTFMTFAEGQVNAKITEIVESNSDLMSWYNTIPTLIDQISNWFWLEQDQKDMLIGGLNSIKDTVDSYVDFDAEVVELDWDKYLDAEGQAALDNLLAELRAEVIEQGVPEYYEIDINPIVDEMLTEYGLDGIFTLFFQPVVIPAADLVVFAAENMLYGYAEFVDNLAFVLENTSADATIVLTPVSNPLHGYSFKGIDFTSYAESVDSIVDLLNAHLYGIAVANENVVFVNSENADNIYDALNVYCDHVHDSCLDDVCDRCLATIEPLGHSFTNYVFTPAEKCTKNGTRTAKCDRCDETHTETVPNTPGPHKYSEATCTAAATCEYCKDVDGEPLPHELGDWRVTKDPTSNSEGMRERKCLNCEYRVTEEIPYKTLSTISTVAIIVSCVAVLGGISALIAGRLRKKNKI